MHVKVRTTFFGIRSRTEFRCNESTAACVWPSGVLSHQISCRIFSRTTCKHFNSFFSPIVERPQLGFSKIALAHSEKERLLNNVSQIKLLWYDVPIFTPITFHLQFWTGYISPISCQSQSILPKVLLSLLISRINLCTWAYFRRISGC